MISARRKSCVQMAGLAVLAAVAVASLPGAAAVADGATSPPDCGTRDALYVADKGLQVWVTRRGTMTLAENPLRPLSHDEVMVLEVVVKGRLATAWGPDFDNLRQGNAPRDLEREGAKPIRWEAGATPYPPSIRVVGEDGRVLFGPMRFDQCGEAPAGRAVAAPAARASRRASDKTGRSRDSPRLPQGAIPSLSLPQGAVD